jgi:hypothetical protein
VYKDLKDGLVIKRRKKSRKNGKTAIFIVDGKITVQKEGFKRGLENVLKKKY